MTTAHDHLNRARWATVICGVGVVVTGLSIEISVISLSISAAQCIGLTAYIASVCGSRIKTAKLLAPGAGLLAAVSVLLQVILDSTFDFSPVFWPWLHRIFRVWWLLECSAIILALLAIGIVTIEVAAKLGGETTRKRFQWCVIAAASSLVVVNIAHFLRRAGCADCFFPYGLPFTLYTEGGYGGGGGIVWLGLLADAALIAAFAATCTVLWNRIANRRSTGFADV